jgi:hypothetical protein
MVQTRLPSGQPRHRDSSPGRVKKFSRKRAGPFCTPPSLPFNGCRRGLGGGGGGGWVFPMGKGPGPETEWCVVQRQKRVTLYFRSLYTLMPCMGANLQGLRNCVFTRVIGCKEEMMWSLPSDSKSAQSDTTYCRTGISFICIVWVSVLTRLLLLLLLLLSLLSSLYYQCRFFFVVNAYEMMKEGGRTRKHVPTSWWSENRKINTVWKN